MYQYYQYHNGLLPRSFDNFFLPVNQVHNYFTRSTNLYQLSFCRTNVRKFSVSYQAPKFFNSLSDDIRSAPSITSFFSKLNSFLFTL
jgi:hypothetical protein